MHNKAGIERKPVPEYGEITLEHVSEARSIIKDHCNDLMSLARGFARIWNREVYEEISNAVIEIEQYTKVLDNYGVQQMCRVGETVKKHSADLVHIAISQFGRDVDSALETLNAARESAEGE